jgi:hypothetical protein
VRLTGCRRIVAREEARVNGDDHGSHVSCGSGSGASPFLTGLVTCFATHDGIPARSTSTVIRLDAATECRCPGCLVPPPERFTAALLEKALRAAVAVTVCS